MPAEAEVRRPRASPDQHQREADPLRAIDPDDATTADFGEVRRILRAAKRHHTLGTGGHHPLWATEIWWSTKPPDPHGVRARKQARYLEQALYLLWRQGAKVVINLQVRDPRYDRENRLQVYAGLYTHGNRPKPALRAFRFPFVTDRASKRVLRAWGKAPRGGRLAIERKVGGRLAGGEAPAGGRRQGLPGEAADCEASSACERLSTASEALPGAAGSHYCQHPRPRAYTLRASLQPSKGVMG